MWQAPVDKCFTSWSSTAEKGAAIVTQRSIRPPSMAMLWPVM
jgi:hypothetical protein